MMARKVHVSDITDLNQVSRRFFSSICIKLQAVLIIFGLPVAPTCVTFIYFNNSDGVFCILKHYNTKESSWIWGQFEESRFMPSLLIINFLDLTKTLKIESRSF